MLSTRDTVSFKVVDNENTRTQQKNPLVAVDVEKSRGARGGQAQGIGGMVVGLDGSVRGAVVGGDDKVWKLAGERIAKKAGEGDRWRCQLEQEASRKEEKTKAPLVSSDEK